MEAIAQVIHTEEPVYMESLTITTSLYELIGTIIDVVQPGEDQLVVETVLDLFDTGQVKFLRAAASVVNN